MHSSRMRTIRRLTVGGSATYGPTYGEGLPATWHCRRADPPPPVNRMTHVCENITLPRTSYAGGNKQVLLLTGFSGNNNTRFIDIQITESTLLLKLK